MNLTFWLPSFVSTLLTDCIPVRAICSSVTLASWPHLEVAASDAAAVAAVVIEYSAPGATARGLSFVKIDSPVS
jgi:hypothetical protein